MQRVQKSVVLGLILGGILFSLLNFLPQVQASSIRGTTTNLSDPDLLYYYFCHYGPQYMNQHWLEGMDYCLDNFSNCMIYQY
jgi:hypothetical protein